MSRENVEIVRRWIDAFNEGGLHAVMDSYWHEHVEFVDPPNVPDAGRHVGKAAVRQRVESFEELGWDGRFRVDELIDAGEEVVMVWRVVGRAPAGDMPLDFGVAFVVLLEDGKVRRVRWYLGKEEALEAVGLSEQAAAWKSPGNVELARSYFEEIARASREDFDPETTISRMAEYWDPQIEWDTRGGPVEDVAGVYRGIEGASQWCREWFEAWETLHFEYELVDAGEQVVVTLPELRMRGRSSGIEVAMGKHAWVITFREGLMVHHRLYTSQAEALEAVGLRE